MGPQNKPRWARQPSGTAHLWALAGLLPLTSDLVKVPIWEPKKKKKRCCFGQLEDIWHSLLLQKEKKMSWKSLRKYYFGTLVGEEEFEFSSLSSPHQHFWVRPSGASAGWSSCLRRRARSCQFIAKRGLLGPRQLTAIQRERERGEQCGKRKEKEERIYMMEEGERQTDWLVCQSRRIQGSSKVTVPASSDLKLGWTKTKRAPFTEKVRTSTLWLTHPEKGSEVCSLFLSRLLEWLSACCIQGTGRVARVRGAAQYWWEHCTLTQCIHISERGVVHLRKGGQWFVSR